MRCCELTVCQSTCNRFSHLRNRFIRERFCSHKCTFRSSSSSIRFVVINICLYNSSAFSCSRHMIEINSTFIGHLLCQWRCEYATICICYSRRCWCWCSNKRLWCSSRSWSRSWFRRWRWRFFLFLLSSRSRSCCFCQYLFKVFFFVANNSKNSVYRRSRTFFNTNMQQNAIIK